ncbi:TetR/AcrR family transcriptional regulator [Rummeliibacillus pycnus]|uniref:TetR/AcrR family transcriptional regulator n=1 Tax=Rummeliibacillus pycnus TaxID=101070 RepID=UPI0037C7C106
MNKNDLRVIKTKKALHQALIELINEKDYEDISITDICKVGQVNRGTFYGHYVQKEDLFNEVMERIMNDFFKAYFEPYSHQPILNMATLKSETIGIFQHILEYKQFYQMVFSYESTIKFHNIFSEKIKEWIKEEIEQYKYKHNGIDVDLYASYQTYAIIGMIVEWVNRNFSYSVSYMNEQLTKILQLKD